MCVCECVYVYACHCEVAPVCAAIAADRGRETANFSTGEREEGAQEGFDEQACCRGGGRHRARPDDRLTGPRQTSNIDQNHGGPSLLIT